MLNLGRNLCDLGDQLRRCIRPWVCRIYPVDIREDNERIGIDKCRDNRREIVVVSDFDLIHRHGVVLIDDGNDLHIEQGEKGTARVDVLMMTRRILLCQEHLCHRSSILMKELLIDVEKVSLSDRRKGLPRRHRCRTFLHAERIHSRRNCTGGNEENLLALIGLVDQLTHKMLDAAQIHSARGMRQRTCSNLYDNALRLGETRPRIHSSILGLSKFRLNRSPFLPIT